MYKTSIDLTVIPIIYQSLPHIKVKLDNTVIFHGYLGHQTTWNLHDYLSPGKHAITLRFDNKDYNQSQLESGHDMAVRIQKIVFNKIDNKQFIWSGKYRPIYPEPWISQERKSKIIPTTLLNIDYLGWNGIWKLNFEVPVFSWIHKITDLGWIYD